MTENDTKNARKIAERYVALSREILGHNSGGAELVARRIIDWHLNKEPLRLDLLAEAEQVDLAHDVGGIMRCDEHQSARFALAYHRVSKDQIEAARLLGWKVTGSIFVLPAAVGESRVCVQRAVKAVETWDVWMIDKAVNDTPLVGERQHAPTFEQALSLGVNVLNDSLKAAGL